MTRNAAEKFVELANKRVNRAIKDIRLVGNLANKNNYQYSDDQVKKIVSALQRELNALKSKFEQSEDNGGDTFRL